MIKLRDYQDRNSYVEYTYNPETGIVKGTLRCSYPVGDNRGNGRKRPEIQLEVGLEDPVKVAKLIQMTIWGGCNERSPLNTWTDESGNLLD